MEYMPIFSARTGQRCSYWYVVIQILMCWRVC